MDITQDTNARINAANEANLLFAHMLEFTIERGTLDQQRNLKDFFDILDCNPKARYTGIERTAFGSDLGMPGLPTTSLHPDFPVELWSAMSRIGILIDGTDTENASPDFFAPHDSYSRMIGGHITFHKSFLDNQIKGYPDILEPQIKAELGDLEVVGDGFYQQYRLDLSTANRSERRELATDAIRAFWEQIEQTGWDQYAHSPRDPMNETTVSVKLPSVMAVLVADHEGSPPFIGGKDNVIGIAAHIAKSLKETYPEAFPEDTPALPLVLYNQERMQVIEPTMVKNLARPEAMDIAPDKPQQNFRS